VRTAERSHKAAIEDQQYIPATQIQEPDGFSADISQLEIGSKGIYGNFRHIPPLRADF
jgi:hypothetical protein